MARDGEGARTFCPVWGSKIGGSGADVIIERQKLEAPSLDFIPDLMEMGGLVTVALVAGNEEHPAPVPDCDRDLRRH